MATPHSLRQLQNFVALSGVPVQFVRKLSVLASRFSCQVDSRLRATRAAAPAILDRGCKGQQLMPVGLHTFPPAASERLTGSEGPSPGLPATARPIFSRDHRSLRGLIKRSSRAGVGICRALPPDSFAADGPEDRADLEERTGRCAHFDSDHATPHGGYIELIRGRTVRLDDVTGSNDLPRKS